MIDKEQVDGYWDDDWDKPKTKVYPVMTYTYGNVGGPYFKPHGFDNYLLSYEKLEQAYSNATYGTVEPNVIITDPKTYSTIKALFGSQQQFAGAVSGYSSIKYNNATVVVDKYAPGGTLKMGGKELMNEFLDKQSKK